MATALVAGVGLPSAAAEGGGANNVVVATATADGSVLTRSGVQVAPVGGPAVDSDNVAEATSFACVGCRTVAVAMQAVLVSGDPNVVTPSNAASSWNIDCTKCVAYAYAYQYVVSTGGPVYLNAAAQQKLNDLRGDVATLASSRLSSSELTEQLDVLKLRFKAIVDDAAPSSSSPR